MTTHSNTRLKIAFETPDALTVRQQLEFMSLINDREYDPDDLDRYDSQKYEAYWRASIRLLTGWKCEWMPDPKAIDLDKPSEDPRTAQAIAWTGNIVFNAVMALDSIPKG